MSNFLIKFGSKELPNSFLTDDGYVTTPNQRTELEAYRDADIKLHRTTSPEYKTSIQLTFCPMSQSDKELLQNIIRTDMENEIERKVSVTYWNEETNDYKDGEFYISDVTYATLGFFGGEKWYKSFTCQLTEY